MTIPTDLAAIRRRLRNRMLGTSIPASTVAAYVLALTLGLSRRDALVTLLWVFVPILIGGAAFQTMIVTALLERAAAVRPGDAPGARLVRMLELPRRIELLVHTSVWLVGSLVFGAVACRIHGLSPWLVPLEGFVGLLAALFPGLILANIIEQELLPLAVEEAQRTSAQRLDGRGFFWPRQRWYLPYAFGVAIACLFGFAAIVAVTRMRETTDRIGNGLAAQGLGNASLAVVEELDSLLGVAGAEIGGLALVLLSSFLVLGVLLAKRQSRAAAALEASLRALARGEPAPPRWVATDELGDLSLVAATITREMQSVFNQLRAMAGGDLRQEWKGESGLVAAFRDSQASMLELARLMVALSKGDLSGEARIPGELGAHVAQLLAAFRATVEQAQTIARGDLRSEVEVPGALGQALQRMTHNLRSMVGQTQGVSGDIGDIVVSLQSAAAQLSAATTEQVAAVTETANTVTEMAQTSAVSADRAAELIRQGEAATQVVEDGSTSAIAAVDAMNAISASLTSIAAASAALAEGTKAIEGITETVGFLADQSSTLAINASIEAARAGEAGKGFAVVAREVRSLAADSRKAAGQIRNVLGELAARTREVDAAVSAGTSTVQTGNERVQQVGEVVAQLGVTVNEAVGLMRQVEGSARQHQAGVAQVSQAMTNMQKASESIRDGARSLGDLSGKARALSESLQRTSGTYALPQDAPREEVGARARA